RVCNVKTSERAFPNSLTTPYNEHRELPKGSGGLEVVMFRLARIFSSLTFAAIAVAARAQYSFVDLDPGGFNATEASGAASGQQVGFGDNGVHRGLLWTGTAGSYVDMTPTSVASASTILGTDGTQQVGYIARNGDPSGAPRAWVWNGTPESGNALNPQVPIPW